jgi:polyisoprenoid-binding protein YceI
MNFIVNVIFLILSLFSATCFATEKYFLNSQLNFLTWYIVHSGSRTESGKLPAEATLYLDKKDLTKNYLEGKIALSELPTGDQDLDSNLKALASLDAKYSYVYFKSSKMVFSDNDNVKIYGKIILFGMGIPIVVNAHLNKLVPSSLDSSKILLLSASTEINPGHFPKFLIPKNISQKNNYEIKINASLRGSKYQA